MSLTSLYRWVKKQASAAGRKARQRTPRRPHLCRPRLEVLEDRRLLAAGFQLQHIQTGAYVNSYVGVGFQRNVVARLEAPSNVNPQNVQISINWGDGLVAAGELADVGPYQPGVEEYHVKGSHVYQQPYSMKPITVTVVGQTFFGNGSETAEANVYNMPSGVVGTPPHTPPFSGTTPANVTLGLQGIPSGAYVNTQVGDTTPQQVGWVLAQLNGQADTVQGHFTPYINWGDSSEWTTGQVVFDHVNGTVGWFRIVGSPPPYTQPSAPGQPIPIVVYVTDMDGTSTDGQTAMAIVAANPYPLVGQITAELKQMLPSEPTAPTVRQSGNVMTVTWGGLIISNDVSTAAPGAVGRESANDVKTFVDMLKDAVSRSTSLQGTLQQIVDDPSHPVRVIVGLFIGNDITGTPVFIDQFSTGLVDVGQLGQFSQPLPANQGVTQGEEIAHILGERRYAATNPGASFATAHINGGIAAQNAYRRDVKAATTVTGAVPATVPAGSLDAGQVFFSNGTEQRFILDPNDRVQAGPVIPTPRPSNLAAVANAFTHSPEYYSTFITHAYQTYLGRSPSPAEVGGWLQAMQNGLKDEQLEAEFIGSPEYIANHGGAGAGWVTGMYHDLLGRTPSQAEVNGWVTALANGEPPQQVAYGFAASPEREGIRVRADYMTYLGRQASPAEVQGWVNAFENGASNENVIAGFVGSPESFSHAGNDIPTWVQNAYQLILGRHADPDGLQDWSTNLAQAPPAP